MSETQQADLRADAHTAARVDRALKILETDRMHAAFAFIQLAGVLRGACCARQITSASTTGGA